MGTFDDFAQAALATAGALLGLAIYLFWVPGLILAVPLVVIGVAGRIQGTQDFPTDPVLGRRRLECWPLAQLAVAAIVAWLLLLIATSSFVNAFIGESFGTEQHNQISAMIGVALGGFVTATCSFLFGKENARLGARYAFQAAIQKELSFPPASRGYQAQFLLSIDGIEGDVGWGFGDRKIRAQVVKEQLERGTSPQ